LRISNPQTKTGKKNEKLQAKEISLGKKYIRHSKIKSEGDLVKQDCHNNSMSREVSKKVYVGANKKLGQDINSVEQRGQENTGSTGVKRGN